MFSRLVVLAALSISAAALMAACTSTNRTPTPTTTTPTSRPAPTTTTTVPRTTPTTRLPSSPQPSADQAATVFMQGWVNGNRQKSASVGTASAVATLFASPYAGQPLTDRGCGQTPIVCTWGPYGGGNPNSALYEMSVTQTGSNWYVSSVTIES